MFSFPNYYQQSQGLPAQNGFQLLILQWADRSICLREASKCATVVGSVISAAGLVFNFDPTTALTCTAISGIAWFITRKCAEKLEPQAINMIKHFKELEKQEGFFHPSDAKALGLID